MNSSTTINEPTTGRSGKSANYDSSIDDGGKDCI